LRLRAPPLTLALEQPAVELNQSAVAGLIHHFGGRMRPGVFHLPGVRAIIGIALLCEAAACAGSAAPASGSDTSPSPSAAPVRRDRTVITGGDIREVTASTVFEVVQRLHPEWLVKRNSTTGSTATGRAATMDTDIQVFIGTQRAGNTDILRQLGVNGIESLKYFSASEAQARFGSGNVNGVIQITMNAK
jgi:hypothetical protein